MTKRNMVDSQLFSKDPLALTERAQKGDSEAFGELYQFYYTPVYRYIYFRVNTKEDAQDLTEEVFLKVFKSVKSFKNTNGNPLTFFFTVARNTLIDHYRKKKESRLQESDLIGLKTESSALEEYEKAEQVGMVKQAFVYLTQEQCEVITLRFINDLPNDQIAALLGKGEDAIRQIQCRALKILREKLT